MIRLHKNQLVGIFFIALTILFIVMAMTNKPFFDWVFDRHHNQWSWYSRPLFLIPFCYFSYNRNLAGIAITTFCLFTSMFWFPKPEVISVRVIEFLQFEKEYLYGKWSFSKILTTLSIPISLVALAFSFWKKSLFIGMSVVAFMATGKIIWSIQNAGESGKSILIPAIIGLVICSGLIYFGFKKLEEKQQS